MFHKIISSLKTITWILTICFCVYSVLSVNTGDDWDDMGNIDRTKISNMAKELIESAKVQQRQIFAVRKNHKPQLAYEVGLIIGKIRERYKRMNDIYREWFDRKTNRTTLNPPGVRDFRLFHWVIAMEMVHSIEVDIDKLVYALEMIPKSSLGAPSRDMLIKMVMPDGLPSNPVPAGPPGPPDATGPPGATTTRDRLRAGPDTSKEITTLRFKSEDELKQHYREKYNVRNGRNNNWTLDEYYGVA